MLKFPYPNSRFFKREKDRESGDIDRLWQVFGDAIEFADRADADRRDSFVRSFDDARGVKPVSVRKLTMGLSWIRPWDFVFLGKNAVRYIRNILRENISEKGLSNGAEYLALRDRLLERFHGEECPVHSFPELSLAACRYAEESTATEGDSGVDAEDVAEAGDGESVVSVKGTVAEAAYSIDEIVSQGCFLPRVKLDVALRRWQQRKNLILQGPPGTGKTWLAKTRGGDRGDQSGKSGADIW